jgi:hypothetical protein
VKSAEFRRKAPNGREPSVRFYPLGANPTWTKQQPAKYAAYQITDAEVQQANRLFDDLMQRLEATFGNRARPVVSGRFS